MSVGDMQNFHNVSELVHNYGEAIPYDINNAANIAIFFEDIEICMKKIKVDPAIESTLN